MIISQRHEHTQCTNLHVTQFPHSFEVVSVHGVIMSLHERATMSLRFKTEICERSHNALSENTAQRKVNKLTPFREQQHGVEWRKSSSVTKAKIPTKKQITTDHTIYAACRPSSPSQGEIKASQQVCLRQVSFSPLMAMSFVSLLIQPAERVYRL